MFDTKPAWASRVVLGNIVAVAAMIAALFSVKVDDATQQIIVGELDAILSAAFIIIGNLVSLWGRFKATQRVTLTGKP